MISTELLVVPEFAQVGGKKRGTQKGTKRKGGEGKGKGKGKGKGTRRGHGKKSKKH